MGINLLDLLEKLVDAGLDFVIVGGVAARLHGSSRLTHDIDVVPGVEPKAWARVVDLLWDTGARPRIPEPRERVRNIDNVLEWVRDKGMLALSFRSPDGSAELDLLVGETSRLEGLRDRAIRVRLDGREYMVASIDDLIAMKTDAGRPQDLLDIETLERIKPRSEAASRKRLVGSG